VGEELPDGRADEEAVAVADGEADSMGLTERIPIQRDLSRGGKVARGSDPRHRQRREARTPLLSALV
jgi:hypothetical protein